MDIVPVPDSAKRAHPNYRVVSMGPPTGVASEDCGTAEMLLGQDATLPGFPGRDQLVYYRPTQTDLDLLNAGGLLVMNQLGQIVQPFSLGVWPASRHEGDSDAHH